MLYGGLKPSLPSPSCWHRVRKPQELQHSHMLLPAHSLCTAALQGDASSAPNHLGSVGARSTIPPSQFPRLTLLQYFLKKGKDVFTSFLLCFSSTPPFFFRKMDAEDSRAAPAVLETGCLHPGRVQALFECVSGAGFRSRRE